MGAKVRESRGSFFVGRESRGVVREIRKLMHQVKSKLCDQSLSFHTIAAVV